MLNHVEKTFNRGTIDEIEAHSIPDGAASASLNWLTAGDSIELRRGYAIKGTRIEGIDPVTGVHVGKTTSGLQVLFWTYLRKLVYFDKTTEDHIEIGSDVIPAAASGEDMSFYSYNPIAGAQVWMSSPKSGYFKIMMNGGKSATVAPGIKDNYDATKNFKGYILIQLNRAFLWGLTNDKTGLYLSYIDEQNTTAVAGEAFATGDGSPTYSATLAAVTGKRTCYGVVITHSSETFTDNNDGTLTGSAGGSGTVNYSTGLVSVTFAAAPGSGAITADYNWEDATNKGIADFTYSATRLAGQGQVFRQDEGGSPIQSVGFFSDIGYCFHKLITYALTLGLDDTTATNLPYRTNVGIPNWRAAVPTGSGIYYIDDVDEANPRVRILRFGEGGSTEVIPVQVSENIKLGGYRFDKAAGIEWSDYILFACRTANSTYNNRVLMYNKRWKAWDVADYFVTSFTILDGSLIGGDSLSPNALELFSGFDDDTEAVENYWISNLSDLQIRELKKSRELWLRGLIQKDQAFDVYLSTDNSDFVKIGTVSGSGDYVDAGQRVSIGSRTIGKLEVGGGGVNPEEFASPYFRRIKIRNLLDKFERIKVKYVATGLGFVNISEREFHDISKHGERLPAKYASNNS